MSEEEMRYRILETDKGFIPQITQKDYEEKEYWSGLCYQVLSLNDGFWCEEVEYFQIKYACKKTYKKTLKVIEKYKKKEASETFKIIKIHEVK